jgi:hypothetical protein
MVMRRAMVLAIVAAWPAGLTFAQTFDQALQAAQQAGHSEPDFLLSERWSLSGRWSVNAVYSAWTNGAVEGERYWLIRRAVGERTGQSDLVWADSRTCPAVRSVLTAMEDMAPPRPQVTGLHGEPERIVVVGDGALVTFRSRWAQAGSEGALLEMELTGNVNAPHAIWWAESVEVLQDCWTETRPE